MVEKMKHDARVRVPMATEIRTGLGEDTHARYDPGT